MKQIIFFACTIAIAIMVGKFMGYVSVHGLNAAGFLGNSQPAQQEEPIYCYAMAGTVTGIAQAHQLDGASQRIITSNIDDLVSISGLAREDIIFLIAVVFSDHNHTPEELGNMVFDQCQASEMREANG